MWVRSSRCQALFRVWVSARSCVVVQSLTCPLNPRAFEFRMVRGHFRYPKQLVILSPTPYWNPESERAQRRRAPQKSELRIARSGEISTRCFIRTNCWGEKRPWARSGAGLTLRSSSTFQTQKKQQRRMQPAACHPRHRLARERPVRCLHGLHRPCTGPRVVVTLCCCCCGCAGPSRTAGSSARARLSPSMSGSSGAQPTEQHAHTAWSSRHINAAAAAQRASDLAAFVPALRCPVCLPTAMRSCSQACPTLCGCRASWLVSSSWAGWHPLTTTSSALVRQAGNSKDACCHCCCRRRCGAGIQQAANIPAR